MLVGDEVSLPTEDIDVCIPDADGVEVPLYSPSTGIKLEPEGVEEEVVVSTSLSDDVNAPGIIDGEHVDQPPVVGEVISEVIEEGVVDLPQDENLLSNLAVD